MPVAGAELGCMFAGRQEPSGEKALILLTLGPCNWFCLNARLNVLIFQVIRRQPLVELASVGGGRSVSLAPSSLGAVGAGLVRSLNHRALAIRALAYCTRGDLS